jgi:hypothetical protein
VTDIAVFGEAVKQRRNPPIAAIPLVVVFLVRHDLTRRSFATGGIIDVVAADQQHFVPLRPPTVGHAGDLSPYPLGVKRSAGATIKDSFGH